MLSAQEAVRRQRPVLRLSPAVVYGGPGLGPDVVRHSKVLVWLERSRLRVFADSRPPTLLLDMPVASYDLDLGRRPKDRAVTITSPDGDLVRVTLVAGACACHGSGLLRGWTPPP